MKRVLTISDETVNEGLDQFIKLFDHVAKS